jgi:hypothetical protein
MSQDAGWGAENKYSAEKELDCDPSLVLVSALLLTGNAT